MDEIEYKLQSKNPVLITHGISKILEVVRKKIANNDRGEDTSRIAELDSLFTKCKSEDAVISSVACQALVSLVDSGLLTIPNTLAKFISILGVTDNYLPVTSAICNLLVLNLKMRNFNEDYSCPFSIKAPQHPLITVMCQTQHADPRRDVLGHMQSMIHQAQPEYLRHYVELLRPVFMFILCHPSDYESCKLQTWHLLIRTPGTLHIQLEVLQWLRSDDSKKCIDTNNRIFELAELAVAKKDVDLCTAVSPLVMSITLDLFRVDCDPRPNIALMENVLDLSRSNVGSILMFLLSEMLLISPSVYLRDLVKLGLLILDKLNCSQIPAYAVVASILPWMAYASLLSSEALNIATDFIEKVLKKTNWNKSEDLTSNKIFSILCHSSQNLQFYTEFCKYIDIWSEENFIAWFEKLTKATKKFIYMHRIILSGIFLASKNFEIISRVGKLLSQVAKNVPKYASTVLSLVLYKLSSTSEIDETKELVLMLPEMAVSKENVPIVIHTMETLLAGGTPLKYLAIELYLRTWTIEPRCHRHLLAALIDLSKNDQTLKANITCAKAMKFICENRSEDGAELVPLLSQILNKCTDTAGSCASALALRGISALCVSGIADVCSTWRVLAPKMNKEERSLVIKSMCEFFGDISTNVTHSKEDFDDLLRQVLKKLWEFALFETTRDISIVQTAFKALAAYTVDQINLIDLPAKFITSLKPPKKSATKENEDNPVLDLTYIPGICWITMLEIIYEPTRSIAGDLIIKFISDELFNYRSGIYMWPMGEPVNLKYLPEKSAAKAVGEYLRHYKSCSPPDVQKVAVECLRIYSHKYLQALPPVKFELLQPAFLISDEAWSYGITFACYQSAISPTAREFLSKYLKDMTKKSFSNPDDFKKVWHLCTHLQDICRGVTSNVLGPFVEATMNYVVERAVVDIENGSSYFEQLMEKYAIALRDDLVHHDNKSLLSNILEKLLQKIDVDNKIFKFLVDALMGLPTEQIERITLPSVWDKITNEMLEKAIVVRAGLVLKRENEITLSWMNEIIRVSAPISGVHKRVLQSIKNIQSHLRHEKSNAEWLWDLMCRIQSNLHDSRDNNSMESVKFLCDVLFVTIIFEAFEDCIIELSDETSVIESHDVRARLFPQAISILSSMPHWKGTIMQETMEWLNSMRLSTMPIEYKSVFHNALVSLKNDPSLDEYWTTYLSTKGPINL